MFEDRSWGWDKPRRSGSEKYSTFYYVVILFLI
jgi:hypothetical protein